MRRIETYVGQQVYEWAFSAQAQLTMTAIAKVCSALFGTSGTVNGLACTPTSPASMTVQVGAGEIYQMESLEATTCGTLPADTTHTILKQGVQLGTYTTGTFATPGTSGQSINYLIEAQYQDLDISLDPTTGNSPVVLQFYNSTNPATPWSGPNNSGSTSNTFRDGVVAYQIKAGIAATTGSQVTPSPDTGWIGLWVVTVPFGATSLTSGNIAQYTGSPILPTGILSSILTSNLTYGVDSGSANVVQAKFPVPVATLVDGMDVWVKIANANSGATTFTPNPGVISASPVVGAAHAALQGGEMVASGRANLIWRQDISSWVLVECTGAAIQIAPATQSGHAVQLAQIGSVNGSGIKLNGFNNPNLQFNGSGEFGNTGWSALGQFSSMVDTIGLTGSFFTNTSALTAASVYPQAPLTQCGPSQAVTVSGDVGTSGVSAGTVLLTIACFNSSGTFLSNIGGTTVPNGTASLRYVTNGVTPAGTAFVCGEIALSSVTATTGGISFRRLKTEPSTAPSLYSQEASIAALAGALPVVGSVRNLAMSVGTASASATLTADEITVETALGGFGYKLAGFNKTINLATTGAGGMDTGTAPVSGYVALYSIYNPSTQTSALLATNATSAKQPNVYGGSNMPSGYTASALAAVWPTNGSGQFVVGYQMDRSISISNVSVLSSSVTQASPTSLSISSAVPLNARSVSGTLAVASTAASNMSLAIFVASTQIGQQGLNLASGSVGGDAAVYRNLAISVAQTIYYISSNTSGTPTFSIGVTGYDI